MCCTFEKSTMSGTRLYVGEGKRDCKLVHVLAYQNTATSHGPNAMVIPFPTSVKMTQDNIINTTDFKWFLENIIDASKKVTKSFSRGLTLGADGLIGSRAEVFDVGSYTVILAEHTAQIPEALQRVPTNKRPHVSTEFLKGYAALYPNMPVAICCWEGHLEDAEPLLWWYEPRDPSSLFVPTMDAHDGRAPVLGEMVKTDHIISVGMVSDRKRGHRVSYDGKLPDSVKDLLPQHVYGKRLPHRIDNADCFVKAADLHGGGSVTLSRGLDYHSVMNGWY